MARYKFFASLSLIVAIAGLAFVAYTPSTMVDVSLLPIMDAIELSKGERTIYIFEQPNCSFCETLSTSLSALKNTRVLIFPLAAHGAKDKDIAKNAWCSTDKAQAWRNVLAKRVIHTAHCDTSAIDRNLALAKQLGLKGTPSIIFSNGVVHQGHLSTEEIERMLTSPKQN